MTSKTRSTVSLYAHVGLAACILAIAAAAGSSGAGATLVLSALVAWALVHVALADLTPSILEAQAAQAPHARRSVHTSGRAVVRFPGAVAVPERQAA